MIWQAQKSKNFLQMTLREQIRFLMHLKQELKIKKNCHIIFYWDNVGTKQGTQALAEYCSLLKDLDLELWKKFFKKVLKVGAKSWIVENYGTQIMNAINDKVYSKKFLNDLEFYDKEFKANNFGQFISDNVTDGDVIVSAAKLLKTLENKKTALVNVIDNDKKIESKLKAFAKTCNQLETKLGFEKSDF